MSKSSTKNNHKPFQRVGVIARRSLGAEVRHSIREVYQVLHKRGLDVLFEDVAGDALDLKNIESVSRDELGARCDLLIVVGGDGSLLSVGRDLAAAQVPVLGINRGGLGFLANVAPDHIEIKLSEVLDGGYFIEDHFLLEAAVVRDGVELLCSPALNDVVVHPARVARMLDFSLWVDGEFVYDQRSDGLIIATPTGSTAYALSAGGPIMHPSLNAIVIVPMFPHTLTSRPIVLGGDVELRLTIGPAGYPTAQMVCDSQVRQEFKAGDEVRVRKFAAPLRMLYPTDHSFYEACRSKLDWATRLGKKVSPS